MSTLGTGVPTVSTVRIRVYGITYFYRSGVGTRVYGSGEEASQDSVESVEIDRRGTDEGTPWGPITAGRPRDRLVLRPLGVS